MPKRNFTGNLYDPRSGGQSIRINNLRLDGKPSEPTRTNYFIESGSGTFWADASTFAFGPKSLLFFVPYQHIRFIPDRSVQGEVIQFHANFLCVETFHAEAGCSGVLFNDPFGIPVVQLDEPAKLEVQNLIEGIRREEVECGLAFSEVMLAYLKVLLVFAARMKTPKAGACDNSTADPRHLILAGLLNGESETNRLADLLQAFFWSRFSQKRVPSPTHRHSKIELAIASVFHSSSVRLEGRWPSVRRPHGVRIRTTK